MRTPDVIRAWKDEDHRLSLSGAERAALPANPAGLVELNIVQLEGPAGGKPPVFPTAAGGCVPKTHSLLCYASRPWNACPTTHPSLPQLCGTFTKTKF